MSDRAQKRWRAFQRPEEKGSNYWRIQMEQGLLDSLHGYCGEERARLAAAAPDLLEALKDILSGWRYIRQDPAHLSIYGVGWDRAQEAAEAAIAKAEGGAE